MYHRIFAQWRDPWQLSVTPSHFAEHLEVVRRHGPRMPVRELSRALAGGRAHRGAIVITLDDGYADNLHYARPLLERNDVPATLFVAAGYLGRSAGFWWDELERLMLTPVDLPPRLRLEVRGQTHEFSLGAGTRYTREEQVRDAAWQASMEPPTERHRLFLALYRLLRPASDPERLRALADLAAWNGAESPAASMDRSLTVAELQMLARDRLVEIGAHTLTHPQLSALSREDQQAEIHRSRVVLAEITGTDVTSFAYPYGGRSDYTADTVQLVRDAGFSGACATVPGVVRRATARFELPRFHVEDCDGDALARRIAAWTTHSG
jgi:peptidoglycan/xylan/chitin deacetylase (PgdA/CDA1 family)